MSGNYNHGIFAKMPGRASGIRFLHSMGVWPSPEAALEMAARRLQADHSFRDRWKGFQLLTAPMDFFLEVLQDGSIIRHQNETELKK